jgi:hypothetical protein
MQAYNPAPPGSGWVAKLQPQALVQNLLGSSGSTAVGWLRSQQVYLLNSVCMCDLATVPVLALPCLLCMFAAAASTVAGPAALLVVAGAAVTGGALSSVAGAAVTGGALSSVAGAAVAGIIRMPMVLAAAAITATAGVTPVSLVTTHGVTACAGPLGALMVHSGVCMRGSSGR